MTTRLFAAIELPEGVRGTLDALVDPRRQADPNLHWTSAATWHVTLAFFGDVSAHAEDAVADALTSVRAETFTVTLGGGGCFPNPAQARVLYLAVGGGAESLSSLSRRVRVAADRVGVPADSTRYVPHLTLARARRAADLTRWLRIVDSFPPVTFAVDGFTLMSSTLHRSGAEHRPLRRYR